MQSSNCDMDLRVRIKEEERDLSPDAFVKFSIENILRPDFGRTPALLGRCKPEGGLAPFPVGHPAAHPHPVHHYHNSRLKLSPYLSANAPFLNGALALQQPRCRSGACRSPSPPLPYSHPGNWSRPAGKGRSTCQSSARPVERAEKEIEGNAEKSRRESGVSQDNGQSRSGANQEQDWPAWVFCTRYSDRPSSGPRARRCKRRERKAEEKRPRTAFTQEQLERLKREFQDNRYLNEKRRQDLAKTLQLNESQIKIWFQNKRAKLKKASGARNPLQLSLLSQGLYNHNPLLGQGQGAPTGLAADGQSHALQTGQGQPGSRSRSGSSGTPSRSTSPIGTCTDSNTSYCKSDQDFDIH